MVDVVVGVVVDVVVDVAVKTEAVGVVVEE